MQTQDQILQAIFDQAFVGIAQIGLDCTWLRVNSRYCQMLGYSESELRTKTLRDITHPDDYSNVLDARDQLLAGTISSHSMEKRYIRRDGSIFWGRLNRSLVRDEEGQPKFFIAVVEDITERVQIEEDLRKREEQLEMAQNAAGVGLWERDLRASTAVTSGQYARLRGLPPEQRRITHEEWVAMTHPDDRDRLLADFQECVERTHIWDEEFRVVWPDSSVHWLLTKGRVFLDETGLPVRMAGATLDITEWKQAEQALRESEQRFRNMADAAPVMIWVSGPDKLATFFNKPWLDFRGRAMEQELGRGYRDGVHPDDLERCTAIYDAAFRARRPFQKECRLRRADGEYRWILDNGIPLYREGEFAGFIGSSVDITEQKLIEERLRASESRLLAAQRLARLGSWERNEVTGKTEFSAEMLNILGMPNHPPRTLMEFLNYVHAEDRECVREGALRARTGGSVSGEYRIVRAGGEVRFVRSVLEAIRNERGEVIRVVGVTQDITDLRRAHEESVARQKLESVGTLASGIAHDFNNLLGGVLAQADMALDELASGSSPEDALKMIRKVALRGSEIVHQLMAYAGTGNEVVGPVDVTRIVKEMVDLLRVSVSKHARLETDLGRDLPAVRISPAQVRQIVMNLVTNASEALGERDGIIRVTTKCVRVNPGSSAAIIDRLPHGDYLQLEVSDTGSGMSPQTRSRVFDPFFTTKAAGRGLGLAVVDGIVRGVGGTIHLTSEPNKGTTFQIVLPCSDTEHLGASSPTMSSIEESRFPHKQPAVLVVEDEVVLRQAVAKMLRRRGFEVLEAADGSSAVDILRTAVDKIDVILLDITIPGATSAEVVTAAAHNYPNTRVILTSAYSQEMVTTPLSVPQVCGFIRKPFQVEDLVTTLRRAALA